MVKEEGIPAEEPPPVIDQSEGCCHEGEEPECKEKERSRRKAARAIYWIQLQPWPEPRKMGKSPHSGIRPKENKKVLGTYRHHRKRRDAMLKMVPQKIQWIAKRRVELRSPRHDYSQGSQLIPKLVRLKKKLDRLDPVDRVRARGNGNQRLQNFRDFRRNLPHHHLWTNPQHPGNQERLQPGYESEKLPQPPAQKTNPS